MLLSLHGVIIYMTPHTHATITAWCHSLHYTSHSCYYHCMVSLPHLTLMLLSLHGVIATPHTPATITATSTATITTTSSSSSSSSTAATSTATTAIIVRRFIRFSRGASGDPLCSLGSLEISEARPTVASSQ